MLRVMPLGPVSDAAQVRDVLESFGPIETFVRRINLEHIVLNGEIPFIVTFKNQEDAVKVQDSTITLPNGVHLEIGNAIGFSPTTLIHVAFDKKTPKIKYEDMVNTILESAGVVSYEDRSLSIKLTYMGSIWMTFRSVEAARRVMQAPEIQIPGVRLAVRYSTRPPNENKNRKEKNQARLIRKQEKVVEKLEGNLAEKKRKSKKI
ncbi:hypothetical protein C8J56DRAFT_327184 [Mycena floridula]|nr:hypothetical protein C8J56DRAFT_327184 [Mycena floridula]